MPNLLDGNGLQVASFSEITRGIITKLQAVFGSDINTDPATPDGQTINIFAQVVEDMLEVLLDVYNIFFPDSCYGVSCDQLFALNGITRKPGSYTRTWVQLVIAQALTLPGVDQVAPFTMADDAGNPFQLVATTAFPAAGTYSVLVEAETFGQVLVLPDTINNILTPTAGVTSVNNPAFSVTTSGAVITSDYTVTGISTTAGMTPNMDVNCADFPAGTVVVSVDSSSQITVSEQSTGTGTVSLTVSTPVTVVGNAQENDLQFKIRRAKSFNLQTVGPSDAIRAAVLGLADVSDCVVMENDTGSTADGVAAHGIWVIVTGGTAAEIAQAIYSKKAGGSAMTGAQTHNVTRPQGNVFTARWDFSLTERLYVRATLNPKVPGTVFDLTVDAAALAAALTYKLLENPQIGDIVAAMAVIEPGAVLSNAQVSVDGSTWLNIVSPSDFQHYFTLALADVTLTQ